MAGFAATALYAATLGTAVSMAVLLDADRSVEGVHGVDVRDADIDSLLSAGVRLEHGAAYIRQLHLEEGELIAITLEVGAASPWLEQILPTRPVSVVADEAFYNLATGNIVLTARADELLARPLDAMPLARPVPVRRVAPSAVFGAPVVAGGEPVGRVAAVLGASEIKRLRVMDTGFNGEPGNSRTVEADCVRFVPITRLIDASRCGLAPADRA
ncbi:MAG: hypothetical protein ACOC05_02525 [Oceanicaulis sp.]